MAKKSADDSSPGSDGSTGAGGNAEAGGDSIMGYFRRIYNENPKLLKVRSNEEVYKLWLADHPDQTELPEKVKNGLSNLKSLLRNGKKGKGKAKGKGKGKTKAVEATAAPSNGTPALQIPAAKLEGLEQQIDDCIVLAKGLDREGLENVIRSLRRARNEIIHHLMG